jgi:hypothetical protein
MIYLRQSTASQEIPLGYFVDSTDGNTEETGLTIANTDIKLWKTGATTLANKNSGGGTHISNGIYYAVLDATDTNTLGPMVIFVHVSGALTVRVETCVLTALVYDSLIAGTDNLQVDILQAAGTAWGSGAITAASIASSAITSAKIASGAITSTGIAANAIGASQIATDAITAAKIAADAIGASELATDAVTEIVTAVWAAVTRTLTANTNLNDLNAAGIRSAVGLASANLDTQIGTLATAANLATVAGYIDTEIAAIKAVTDALPDAGALTSLATASALATVDSNVDAILVDTAEIGAAGAGLTALASQSSVNTIDGIVDDILVDTAEIGAAGAGLTALASQSSVNDLPTNAELATALGTADDAVLAQVALVKAKTDLIPAAPAAVGDIPTADANADALLDRANGVETGITLRQSLRLALAALAGKLSGAATTTVTIRDANDAKARITATVDADGNRTAVTLDAT